MKSRTTGFESSPLFTIDELAEELRVSVKTIYYWVGRSEIPFIKIGRHLRFNRDEVLQYFSDRTPEYTSCLAKGELVERGSSNERGTSHRSLKIRESSLPKLDNKE